MVKTLIAALVLGIFSGMNTASTIPVTENKIEENIVQEQVIEERYVSEEYLMELGYNSKTNDWNH